MLQRSARLQYALLALVAVLALSHFYVGFVENYEILRHGQTRVRFPFYSSLDRVIIVLPEAKAAGLQAGDIVRTINGQPFSGQLVLTRALREGRVGQPLPITWDRPDNPATLHGSIVMTPEREGPAPAWAWLLRGIFLFVPLVLLLTGLWVVLARPRNPHAWLILGILIYFESVFSSAGRIANPTFPAIMFWNVIAESAMPLCLMFFGIYFPQRSRIDERFPWVKWVIAIPIFAMIPLNLLGIYAIIWNFSAARWLLRGHYLISIAIQHTFSALAICWFFVTLGTKLHTLTGDARRRLVVLLWGAGIGLTPAVVLILSAFYRHAEVDLGVPPWLLIPVFLLFLLFPLTLAYVVVVQRAMDVRILVRQGTRYAFARNTVRIISLLLSVLMIAALVDLIRHPNHRAIDLARIYGTIALFVAFRFVLSHRLQQRIDQRFFREAYSAEQVLSELSDEARNFTEVTPLLSTITERIGETLHVERIAVFLRSGDGYRLQLARGTSVTRGSLALPDTSMTITTLTRGGGPATVYRDDPSSWLVDASDAERTALADLSTELLVPLPGRRRLAGVMALGPKRSEEPYSRSDRQLLQSVASQAGLALENAELLENLTAEVAQRERISREIEIAREVQEHLFPQVTPSLPGIDLAGHCRPAQAVGGDYYDFFVLPDCSGDERLALALGDISGKGISAALLMASLRASLRSAAEMQPGDLAMLMRHVNRLVYESSTTNRYATFFYGEVDPESRLLNYVNAGHNPPVVLRGTQVIRLEATGTVIGLLPDVPFTRASIVLDPGDVFIAFTDGISEAMNAAEEEWGEDHMIAAAEAFLSRGGSKSARQILECIYTQADRFTAGAPQHDDMTLLVCAVS
jgi:phosphoserine phosphatase RsbU/P